MAEYLSQGSDDSDLTDCDCFRLDYTAMRFIPMTIPSLLNCEFRD